MINQSSINSMPKAVSTRPEYADFEVFFAGARHQACASQSTRVMLLCLVGNVCLHSLALLHACPTHTVLMQCSLPCSTLIALMILMFASILIMLLNTHYIKCITIFMSTASWLLTLVLTAHDEEILLYVAGATSQLTDSGLVGDRHKCNLA